MVVGMLVGGVVEASVVMLVGGSDVWMVVGMLVGISVEGTLV